MVSSAVFPGCIAYLGHSTAVQEHSPSHFMMINGAAPWLLKITFLEPLLPFAIMPKSIFDDANCKTGELGSPSLNELSRKKLKTNKIPCIENLEIIIS